MSVHRTHIRRPAPAMLRHECTACGGCCEGVRVPVFNDDERALVKAAARDLGIKRPIEDKALRLVDGHCVFLNDAKLCRIHGELSPDRKPIPCRQFPLIALQAAEGLRVGIDPASYGAWQSWRVGKPLPDGPAVATSTECPGGQVQVETQFVHMCEDAEATIPGLLGVLTREPAPRGTVPAGFASRWIERMQDVDLEAFLTDGAVGPHMRTSMMPMVEAVNSWSASAPPPWPVLSEASEAWAVEAVRRSIFLRLVPGIPNVSAAALLLCGGMVSAAWTDSRPEAFHGLVTAWLRAMRFASLWRDVAKDAPTLMWLATGKRA